MKNILQQDRYTVTPSENMYLGKCLAVVYIFTSEEIEKYNLTDNNALILIKTKVPVLPLPQLKKGKLIQSHNFSNPREVPLRIMSSCITGFLGDRMCRCHDDMVLYLRQIHQFGEGVFLYLPQEGKSRGVEAKLRDHRLQYGYDEHGAQQESRTFEEASTLLFPDEEFDIRKYGFLKDIFNSLGLDVLEYAWLGSEDRMQEVGKQSDLKVHIVQGVKQIPDHEV